MFPADPDDNYTSGSSFNDDLLGAGYFPTESEPAAFLFGGSAGVVLASTANFVLAPGVVFLSNDQADDYGSFVGVGIPFDWVTDSGLRVGFEVTIGRAFGGSVLGTCQNNFGGLPRHPAHATWARSTLSIAKPARASTHTFISVGASIGPNHGTS